MSELEIKRKRRTRTRKSNLLDKPVSSAKFKAEVGVSKTEYANAQAEIAGIYADEKEAARLVTSVKQRKKVLGEIVGRIKGRRLMHTLQPVADGVELPPVYLQAAWGIRKSFDLDLAKLITEVGKAHLAKAIGTAKKLAVEPSVSDDGQSVTLSYEDFLKLTSVTQDMVKKQFSNDTNEACKKEKKASDTFSVGLAN